MPTRSRTDVQINSKQLSLSFDSLQVHVAACSKMGTRILRPTKVPFVYALRDGKLVHISKVENGNACNCVCPFEKCGESLTAKNNGRILEHHFAHQSGTNCGSGGESGLHRKAKEIFANIKSIALPGYSVKITDRRNPRLQKWVTTTPKRKYAITDVRLEHPVGKFFADVMVKVNGYDLAVEIYVTHKVDEEKINYYQTKNLSAIEIDLSDLHHEFEDNDIVKRVLGSVDHKTWLSHADFAKVEQACRQLDSRKGRLFEIGLGDNEWRVRCCPFPQMYSKKGAGLAQLTRCRSCAFHLGVRKYKNKNVIVCAGVTES